MEEAEDLSADQPRRRKSKATVEEERQQFMVRLSTVEGKKRTVRTVPEMGWDTHGWTGIKWGGRYVGCPERADGSKSGN